MDIQAWTGLISSLGFPIMCCCFMAWYITKKQDEFAKDIEQVLNEVQEMRKDIEQKKQ